MVPRASDEVLRRRFTIGTGLIGHLSNTEKRRNMIGHASTDQALRVDPETTQAVIGWADQLTQVKTQASQDPATIVKTILSNDKLATEVVAVILSVSEARAKAAEAPYKAAVDYNASLGRVKKLLFGKAEIHPNSVRCAYIEDLQKTFAAEFKRVDVLLDALENVGILRRTCINCEEVAYSWRISARFYNAVINYLNEHASRE
jgi:hypothetical protein